MFRVKVREADKWVVKFETEDKDEVLSFYNHAPVPRMLTLDKRVVHKQYSNNSFLYVGK